MADLDLREVEFTLAPLAERIGSALVRLSQAMRAMLWEVARQEGITATQAQTLLSLAAAPEPLTARALAEDSGASAPTLSEVLNTLERKGLVERKHNSADRRQVRIHLTESGVALAARMVDWNGLLSDAIQALPPADRGGFYRSLLTVLSTLERESVVQARVCPSCTHYLPTLEVGESAHGCALTRSAMADTELRVDCPEFVIQR